MQLLYKPFIYQDGKHNAFTSMVYWKGKDWVAFRNGASHKSDDGRILLINSRDFFTWSDPQEVINTEIDDRELMTKKTDYGSECVSQVVSYPSKAL